VHLTTLSPPALLGDLLLVYLCHKATETLDVHAVAMRALGLWMLLSKVVKLLGHYRRYPADFLLLPVSILFGYFHGAIKIYAAVTLNVVRFFFIFSFSFSFLFFFLAFSAEAACIHACTLFQHALHYINAQCSCSMLRCFR
jgi:hypothetical protein